MGILYELKENNQTKVVVVPIRGYGLWSTLYGFISISGDGKEVKGITFYEHAETPGLGEK